MCAAFAAFRRSVAAAFALTVGAACAPKVEGPLPGASDALTKPTETERPPPPPVPAWDAYSAARQWPPINAAPFISRGHQPEQLVDVRASPDSRASYSTLVTDSVFPDGSVLAELSHDAEGLSYGMRKLGGNWSFFELDPHGGVLASGALALCAGCHAQAPADSVFGLPRDAVEVR